MPDSGRSLCIRVVRPHPLPATHCAGTRPVEPGEGERTAAGWVEGFEGFKGFKEFEHLRSRGGYHLHMDVHGGGCSVARSHTTLTPAPPRGYPALCAGQGGSAPRASSFRDVSTRLCISWRSSQAGSAGV